jgi:hypothetical protein
MIISQHLELLANLICIKDKAAMTVDGVKLMHCDINDAQAARLIEQCAEIIEKHNKLVNNLLKLAKAHLDTFKNEQ